MSPSSVLFHLTHPQAHFRFDGLKLSSLQIVKFMGHVLLFYGSCSISYATRMYAHCDSASWAILGYFLVCAPERRTHHALIAQRVFNLRSSTSTLLGGWEVLMVLYSDWPHFARPVTVQQTLSEALFKLLVASIAMLIIESVVGCIVKNLAQVRSRCGDFFCH